MVPSNFWPAIVKLGYSMLKVEELKRQYSYHTSIQAELQTMEKSPSSPLLVQAVECTMLKVLNTNLIKI